MISPIAQRWRDRRGSYRPAGEPFDPARFEVSRIHRELAKRFVVEHHYSRSFPAERMSFGLHRRAELVGVLVLSEPVNRASLKVIPGDPAESGELGRLVLLDDVRANAETWFLARAFDLLRREGIRGLVSFSDPVPRSTVDGRTVFAGHVGTIYQAHNAVFLGRAHADTVLLLPDGTIFPRRLLVKLRKRGVERGWRYAVERLLTAGATPPANDVDDTWIARALAEVTRPMRHEGNLKYAWALDKRLRRHLPESKPYPKLDELLRGAA